MTNHYDLIVLILGLAFFAAAVLPPLLEKTPVSLPMFYVAVGMLLPNVWAEMPRIDPLKYSAVTERLTELAVIISLMSAGLKLDRPIGWQSWKSTWRLLGITMPLCIAALAWGGMWMLGLPLAAALLLGGAIAPTDPVLASGVQVGPPGEKYEAEGRFVLTSEAGLNDGLAFPFVNLAMVLAATGLAREELAQWLALDVAWKITAGVVVGAIIGHAIAVWLFRFYKSRRLSEGFVATALTLIAYGGTQLAHGYGFLGVFFASVMFRRYERDHEYHKNLHDFSEQIERLFMAALLLLLGASITHGLLSALTWPSIILGLLFLLVVRPAAGFLGLAGSTTHRKHRWFVAVFGIRGLGTLYYLAYGLNRGYWDEYLSRTLWAASGFIILASIILHSSTAAYVVKKKPLLRAVLTSQLINRSRTSIRRVKRCSAQSSL
jgi:NhaP-type Na+/H+ or K+/H+ antiporter